MSEIKITKDNFQSEVIESDKPVLLDFWAAWCGPCQIIAPTLGEIAAERPDVKIGKINVDEEMELAGAFQVSGIPTLAVVKEGKVTNLAVGVQSKQALLDLLR